MGGQISKTIEFIKNNIAIALFILIATIASDLLDAKARYDKFFASPDPTVFDGYTCIGRLLSDECIGKAAQLADFLASNAGTGTPIKLKLKIRFLGGKGNFESEQDYSKITEERCSKGSLEPVPEWMGGTEPPKPMVYFFQSEDNADHPNGVCGRILALVLPGLKFPTTYRSQTGEKYDVVIVGRFHVAEDRTGTMMARWDLIKADD